MNKPFREAPDLTGWHHALVEEVAKGGDGYGVFGPHQVGRVSESGGWRTLKSTFGECTFR